MVYDPVLSDGLLRDLLDLREQYVKLREYPAQIIQKFPDSGLGAVMAEQCRNIDHAIASIDAALTPTERQGRWREP
jgi:hypothetical protein